LIEEDLKSVVKIQFVDSINKTEQATKGTIDLKLKHAAAGKVEMY
jgi:hypothetical protein